jgi:PKD repeat protein
MVRKVSALLVGLLMASMALASSAVASISFDIYRYDNPTLTGQSVQLYVDATTTCGDVTGYTWRFGDGSVRNTTSSSINHTWQEAGEYNVTVTVTNSCGETETGSYTQTVKPDLPPVGVFTTTIADLSVYADPSGTHDDDAVTNGSDTPEYYYYWQWGDGTSDNSYAFSSHGLATHRYTTPGTYTITMTPYDTAWNAGDPVTRTVTVPAPRDLFEDTSPAVRYRGSWTTISCPRISCSPNQIEHRSIVRGSKARFTFTGTQVTMVVTEGPKAGRAAVYLDGVLQTRVNFYRPTIMDGVQAYVSDVLPSGTHTLRVELIRNQRINLDAFLVRR